MLPVPIWPTALRRIAYHDPLTGKVLVFLTNNFMVPALTIAHFYRCRWEIDHFSSDNAVRTQVWIAIAVCRLHKTYQMLCRI